MKPVNSLCKELATDLCKDWEYMTRTVGKLPHLYNGTCLSVMAYLRIDMSCFENSVFPDQLAFDEAAV